MDGDLSRSSAAVGFAVTEARAIVALVPTDAWQAGLDADGDVLGSSQSARVRGSTKLAATKVPDALRQWCLPRDRRNPGGPCGTCVAHEQRHRPPRI
jgi:hypothetical protein